MQAYLFAGAAALAFGRPAEARQIDPATVDTIVVTGTKTADAFGEKSGIPLDRLPQSVQVIANEALVERAARSVGDVLRDVPSASTGSSRVSRYQSFTLTVRGFIADQMRNGVRQRYYEDIDASALSNVGRVEVLKGPSAVLFGQSAVGGVISFVTKRPTPAFEASGALTLGTDDLRVVTLDVGGPVSSTLGLRLTGEVERSGTFVDEQDLHRDNVALNLAWRPSDSVAGHLVAEYLERRTLNNPGLPLEGTILQAGFGPLPRSRFLGEPAAGRLEAHGPLLQAWADLRLSEHWTLTPRLQYQEFNSSFTQVRLRGLGPDGATVTRNGRSGREDDAYSIAQLDLEGQFGSGPIAHKLLIGYEYDRERGAFFQQTLANVGPINAQAPEFTFGPGRSAPAFTFAFRSRGDLDGHSLYAQDQLALSERWDVVAGVRRGWYDYTSVFNDAVDASELASTTWQLGTTYRLGGGLSLFGGYNTGFDLENVLGARSATGEAFEPEESNQLEAGVRYARGPVRLSLAAFELERRNYLTDDPLNAGFQVQAGEARVRGVEMEAEAQPLSGWRVSGGYAYLDSEVTRSNAGDQGSPLGETPRHRAVVRSSLALGNTGAELRGAAYHVGRRRLFTGSAVELPDYVLVDLGLGYDLARTRLDLTVTNLLDKRYFTGTGAAFSVYPGDPRTVSLRLGYRFGGE